MGIRHEPCMHRMAQLLLLLPAALAVKSVVQLSLENSALDPNAARSSRNVAYFGAYTLGGTQFTGCFDTGSADLWVPSSQCTSGVCSTKTRYTGGGSRSQITNEPFEIEYVTGEVAGVVAEDVLSIGSPAVTIPEQAFGDAGAVSLDFLSASCDGLFGLAFPTVSSLGDQSNPYDGPFFSMVAEGLLDSNMFALYLNPQQTDINAGQLIFGGGDTSLYTGSLKTYPVLSESYWVVGLTGAAVSSNGVSLGATAAVIDSGTTGIVLSDADAAAISAKVPQFAYWADGDVYNVTTGCTNLGALPTISFLIDGDTYSVPPAAYVSLVPSTPSASPDTCISTLLPGGDPSAVVLGTTFLRQYYAEFALTSSGGATVALAQGVSAPTGATAVFEAQTASG